MMSLKPIEWLAFQRLYFSKPKKGLELLLAGNISKKDLLISSQIKKDWDQLQKFGFQILSWDSDHYPKILKQIYDPPLVLLTKGNWQDWELRSWVAVVGARKATEFGRKKVKEFVKELVAKKIGIVSGLAFGIDAEAHNACVEAGGVTWGVLGSGTDILYPLRHLKLAEKMQVNGGYLSEFPLGTPPYAGNFPQRNRIISGLCHAVIIVEATLRSGSLITARYALEQGREVFVVTPPEENVAYEGTKKLLDEGATPLESAEQVLEAMQHLRSASCVVRSASKNREKRSTKHETRSTNPVLDLLKKPKSLDYLASKLHMPMQQILTELTLLESQGLVKKIPGALWQSL